MTLEAYKNLYGTPKRALTLARMRIDNLEKQITSGMFQIRCVLADLNEFNELLEKDGTN